MVMTIHIDAFDSRHIRCRSSIWSAGSSHAAWAASVAALAASFVKNSVVRWSGHNVFPGLDT